MKEAKRYEIDTKFIFAISMQVLAVATFQNHVCYGGLGLINDHMQ
jgi:transketolase C-terminal domain/subunit